MRNIKAHQWLPSKDRLSWVLSSSPYLTRLRAVRMYHSGSCFGLRSSFFLGAPSAPQHLNPGQVLFSIPTDLGPGSGTVENPPCGRSRRHRKRQRAHLSRPRPPPPPTLRACVFAGDPSEKSGSPEMCGARGRSAWESPAGKGARPRGART